MVTHAFIVIHKTEGRVWKNADLYENSSFIWIDQNTFWIILLGLVYIAQYNNESSGVHCIYSHIHFLYHLIPFKFIISFSGPFVPNGIYYITKPKYTLTHCWIDESIEGTETDKWLGWLRTQRAIHSWEPNWIVRVSHGWRLMLDILIVWQLTASPLFPRSHGQSAESSIYILAWYLCIRACNRPLFFSYIFWMFYDLIMISMSNPLKHYEKSTQINLSEIQHHSLHVTLSPRCIYWIK